MTLSTRVDWICSTFPIFQVLPASGGTTTNVGLGSTAAVLAKPGERPLSTVQRQSRPLISTFPTADSLGFKRMSGDLSPPTYITTRMPGSTARPQRRPPDGGNELDRDEGPASQRTPRGLAVDREELALPPITPPGPPLRRACATALRSFKGYRATLSGGRGRGAGRHVGRRRESQNIASGKPLSSEQDSGIVRRALP